MSSNLLWWQRGVVYQIYPRSFMDSNGDGVGDLPGIEGRLDYLADLGVDAVWISPIYPSPMADFGYDVADYTGIHPLFGTLDDFDRLLTAAHARGLKIILDFVPNHSSDQHPWFLESRSSRRNPKRDWYMWHDAKPDGSPPNNWESFFGGSAWEWDEATQQYYLHLFLKEQPDLNWRNPEVRAAMHDVLRFWLDRGVDGVRIDVVGMMMKHPDLPDNPPLDASGFDWQTENRFAHVYDINQPEVHERIREFNQLFAQYGGDRVIIGETPIMVPADLVPFYGAALDGLHLPFNFMLQHRPWGAPTFRDAITRYEAALPAGATPNYVLGSHDVHRAASKYGPQNARSALLLLLTLRGVPTVYYGDEIGMEDVDIPAEKQQDPWARNMPNTNVGRDPERTPMQWDGSANAGFCPAGVEPWLPVHANHGTVNVAVEAADPTSTLRFFKQLLALRRQYAALHDVLGGGFAWVAGVPDAVLAYTRTAEDARLLAVINFGAEAYTLNLSAAGESADVLLDTNFRQSGRVTLAALDVPAHSGLLLKLA